MEPAEALCLASASIIIHYVCEEEVRKRKKGVRRWWVTDLFKRRVGEELMRDLKFQEISGQYRNFTRMSSAAFEDLLTKIAPKITKMDTKMREAISIQDRLAVTLRFLASGDSYTSLSYTFRISKQSISEIVPEVCAAIIDALKDTIKLPTTPEEWTKICNLFEARWNFPHALGAVDGKHILLQCPMNSGSDYYNYKTNFSIVLLAIVDAEYNFLFAHVGCQGRISDGGVFRATTFYEMMTNNTLGIPAPKTLTPQRKIEVPYFITVDSAFALEDNIMKPYAGDHQKGTPKRVFNYRLSRSRRVVENAFGIISSVFRVLRKPMLLEPSKAEIVTASILYLHNHLRRHSSKTYTPHGVFDHVNEDGELVEGSWRLDNEGMTSMLPLQKKARRSNAALEKIRNEITDYCFKEGSLPWQNNYA